MTKFTFTSLEQVRAYINDLGNFEPAEEWICPICKTKNFGVYHSHSIHCHECKDFARPAAHLPLSTLDKGDPLRIQHKIKEIYDQIKSYELELKKYEGEVAECEDAIEECKQERELLKKMLPEKDESNENK